MFRRPRVLLLIPHLGGGGAERVTELLACNLSADKYELHLGLITQSSDSATALPRHITVHGLAARRVRSSALPLLRLIRRIRPDVILSGMAHLNFLVLLLRPLFPTGTRVLVRQNGTVSSALSSHQSPAVTRLLYRLLYRRADRVICQSQAMSDDLRACAGTSRHRLAVLPNPLDVESTCSIHPAGLSPWTGPGPHLLAIGRLSHEKGFDLLLEAVAQLKQNFPSIEIAIAGQGPEESALRAQCRALQLESAAHLLGYIDAPGELNPAATLFVSSSRHEGIPNALLESAAAGLPIVALPASGGMVDLLNLQPGVWLAREVSTDALTQSLSAALDALSPGQRFSHLWIEPFRLANAIPSYEALIDSTLSEEFA
jgi:glycosyltransferase involved in cell wall biosynthesis